MYINGRFWVYTEELFPRMEFQAAVKEHKAERHAQGFTWGQFVAMLFCQLGQAKSLREICNRLMAIEGKLRHLGVEARPNRSDLSYANQHRPWGLYQTIFQQLLSRCEIAAKGRNASPLRIPGDDRHVHN